MSDRDGEIARLREELEAERHRLASELEFARRVQINLLPTLPERVGWTFSAAYIPAREIGGDFYDVFDLPRRSGTIGLVVADVTGKGVTAALMMAFTRAVLRSAAYNASGPADALRRTNRVLVRDARTGLFVTALIAELELRTGRLTWASAGHESPFVLRAATGRISRLGASGPMLGLFDRPDVRNRRTVLGPGDLFVAWTDGVTDARNNDGAFFGEDRLLRALRAAGGAADVARALSGAVDEFSGDAPRADDLTILAVTRDGPDRQLTFVAS